MPRKKKPTGYFSKLKKNIKSVLKGAGHSKAGKKHLKSKKKKTESVYFKNVKRKSTGQQLKDAGLTKDDLKSLGIK